jgi:hypothetical protein
MIHGNRSPSPWLSEFLNIKIRNPSSPLPAPRSHNSHSHVVVHIHPGAKVILLCIFKNEDRPVAVVKARHDYGVLILVTTKQPPVAHVPEPLPRFLHVFLLVVEMHCHTPVNVSRCYMVLSRHYFRQPEYNVVEEEVHKGLLQLDLLDEGTVPALGVQIHSYTSPPNIQEKTHELAHRPSERPCLYETDHTSV